MRVKAYTWRGRQRFESDPWDSIERRTACSHGELLLTGEEPTAEDSALSRWAFEPADVEQESNHHQGEQRCRCGDAQLSLGVLVF